MWVGLALARLASGDAEAAADLVAEAAEFVGGRSMAFLRPLVALGHGSHGQRMRQRGDDGGGSSDSRTDEGVPVPSSIDELSIGWLHV